MVPFFSVSFWFTQKPGNSKKWNLSLQRKNKRISQAILALFSISGPCGAHFFPYFPALRGLSAYPLALFPYFGGPAGPLAHFLCPAGLCIVPPWFTLRLLIPWNLFFQTDSIFTFLKKFLSSGVFKKFFLKFF